MPTALACSIFVHSAAAASAVLLAQWMPWSEVNPRFASQREIVASVASDYAPANPPPVQISPPEKTTPPPPPETTYPVNATAPAEPTKTLPPTKRESAQRLLITPDVALVEEPTKFVATQSPIERKRTAETQPDRQSRTEPTERNAPATAPSIESQVAIPKVGDEEQTPPQFVSNRPPAYPPAAIARRWEGTVLLRLFVSSRGEIARVEILRSSGHSLLDQAAATAVAGWKAEPARRGGYAVASVEKLPVRFRL